MSVSEVVNEDTYDSWTWPETIEEDGDQASYSSFRSDSKFFTAGFLPPPPRPPYLEDRIASDGLTTCDLCSWALQQYSESKTYSTDVGFIFSQNLFITLTVVSILSALLGAVIMIVVLNFRSRFSSAGSHRTFFCLGSRRYAARRDTTRTNSLSLQSPKEVDDEPPAAHSCKATAKSSWLMLNRLRRPSPVQMLSTSANSTPVVGNHYTVEETYTSINEAVYTELDDMAAATPVYQNCGYMLEVEAEPASSAPSSAYYSDVSAQGTYEMIGQTGTWNPETRALRRPANVRYSSAEESVSVHSNYI